MLPTSQAQLRSQGQSNGRYSVLLIEFEALLPPERSSMLCSRIFIISGNEYHLQSFSYIDAKTKY